MKRSPLKRGKPIARKRAKPKVRPERPCTWSNRCKTLPRVALSDYERYCAKHATAVLDELAGTWVKRRDGSTCLKCGATAGTAAIQWAHIHTRGMRYIRWVVEPYPGNSITLCSGCHFAYTVNEGNWRRFLEARWPGHRDRLERMNAAAEAKGGHIDRAALIVDFRDRLES